MKILQQIADVVVCTSDSVVMRLLSKRYFAARRAYVSMIHDISIWVSLSQVEWENVYPLAKQS